jgi:TetR/AcrR family transcriptional regulator, regulator of biofilm formation and stress response
MATGLQPTQERSRNRRDRLLRAAMDLISEGGTRAVTHRAVAARAGLPPASTTYYFDSIGQLTEEALRLHVEDRVAELRALTDTAAEGGKTTEEIAQRFAASLAARPSEVVIGQFEVYLEAARSPAVRQSVVAALNAFEALAATVLGALGARRPQEAAAAFVAMIDGFALHRIARHRTPEEDSVILFAALRALFISQLMADEDLERWYATLRMPLGG